MNWKRLICSRVRLRALEGELVSVSGGSSMVTGELIQIRQVLVTAAGPLVSLKVIKPDEANLHTIEISGNSLWITRCKFDAVDSGLNLNTIWRNTHSDYPTLLEEEGCRDLRHCEAELPNASANLVAFDSVTPIQRSLVARG